MSGKAQNPGPLWVFDPNASLVTFTIANLGVEVPGTISGLNAETNFTFKNPNESFIKGTAKTQTLFTDNEDRDSHIQKEDFFDVANYPLIKIETKKIYKAKTGFAAAAIIEIKGIRKETNIPFSVFDSKKSRTIISQFTINRLDFGVGDDGVILSSDVKINLKLSFTKPNIK